MARHGGGVASVTLAANFVCSKLAGSVGIFFNNNSLSKGFYL
jgi:hypothetical protein